MCKINNIFQYSEDVHQQIMIRHITVIQNSEDVAQQIMELPYYRIMYYQQNDCSKCFGIDINYYFVNIQHEYLLMNFFNLHFNCMLIA